MFRLATAIALSMVATAASAQRLSTTTMTCGQARDFIAARGTAVLGTGGYTYDRFVRDRSFCEPTEVTQQAFVPTRDTPACPIGYRCIEPSLDDWFD